MKEETKDTAHWEVSCGFNELEDNVVRYTYCWAILGVSFRLEGLCCMC